MGNLASGQHGNATISKGDWHRKRTQMLGARQANVEHALGLSIGAGFPRFKQGFASIFRGAIGWDHDAHGAVLMAFCLVNLGAREAEIGRQLKVVRPLRIGWPPKEITHGHAGRQRQVQSFRLHMHTCYPGEPISVGIPTGLGKAHKETQRTSSMCSPIQANAFDGAQQMLALLAQPHEVQQ